MTHGDGDGLDDATEGIEAGRVDEFGSINDAATAENSPQPQVADIPVRRVDPVIIVVAPVGRGRFRARVEGRTVVTSSRQPFFAAARILAAEGADPLTRIIMRHEGRNDDALSSTIGVAAALSVDESGGGPRFTRWDGERLRGVSPPMSETGGAATTLAEDPENGPALASPHPGEAGGTAGALAAPDAFHGKRTSAP